ncbi:palmitoyltransferase pfa4 [Cadophora sp. DSE1049]|nr:palmitoyltransferase pfa4 [Cadophora sp. DSE1049]
MPGLSLSFVLPAAEQIAIPFVALLISFLSYSSQILFYYIEPEPLSRKQAVWFNIFIAAIWWCYWRACKTDPGKKGWVDTVAPVREANEADGSILTFDRKLRWCKKCDAVKPPRAHHCRKCGRCIPKMDHHCPWTTNCVSHTTFPDFYRFVFYAVVSMSILAYHLYIRLMVIWDNRSLPSYLGPPVWAMVHLFILSVVNSFTLFALGILLIRAGWSLVINTTMIESWEIERHEALVDRSLRTNGYVYASGGQRMRIQHQEFPYDIGIWNNLCQAMGTKNVLMWFMPFGGGPSVESAGNWEVNGFEDADKVWPPPDPDKMSRGERVERQKEDERVYGTPEEEMAAFRKRQQQDHKRWKRKEDGDEESEDEESGSESESEDDEEEEARTEAQKRWTNRDGDTLHDYGVDEDAEVLSEDDIPLGELLRRRKARAYEQT